MFSFSRTKKMELENKVEEILMEAEEAHIPMTEEEAKEIVENACRRN